MNKRSTALLGFAGVAALAAGLSFNAYAQADPDPVLFAALMEEGEVVFTTVGCSACHGSDGTGREGPGFIGNEFLDTAGAIIAQILQPDEEHGTMPAFPNLTDREIAAVATYIRNSWGNTYGIARESSAAFARRALEGGD